MRANTNYQGLINQLKSFIHEDKKEQLSTLNESAIQTLLKGSKATSKGCLNLMNLLSGHW